jgi:hypothetical protein
MELTKIQLVRRQINKPLKYFSIYEAFKKSTYKDKKLYIKVLTEIFIVASEILLKKYRLKLLKLGSFKVEGYRSDKKLIDFGMTKKLGKKVYYTNFHSNRIRYKIGYSDNIINTYYKFNPYRTLNRTLAKTLIHDE